MASARRRDFSGEMPPRTVYPGLFSGVVILGFATGMVVGMASVGKGKGTVAGESWLRAAGLKGRRKRVELGVGVLLVGESCSSFGRMRRFADRRTLRKTRTKTMEKTLSARITAPTMAPGETPLPTLSPSSAASKDGVTVTGGTLAVCVIVMNCVCGDYQSRLDDFSKQGVLTVIVVALGTVVSSPEAVSVWSSRGTCCTLLGFGVFCGTYADEGLWCREMGRARVCCPSSKSDD